MAIPIWSPKWEWFEVGPGTRRLRPLKWEEESLSYDRAALSMGAEHVQSRALQDQDQAAMGTTATGGLSRTRPGFPPDHI